MEHASFAIHNGQPSREDDLKNLSLDALNYLLSEARQNVDAMERELQRRGLLPVMSEKTKRHNDRITLKCKEIELLGLDRKVATEAADNLKRALTADYRSHQLDHKQAVAGIYLSHVTRNCGPAVALICIITIGLNALGRMKLDIRLELLELLGKNSSNWVPKSVINFVEGAGIPSHNTTQHDLDPAKEKSWSDGEAFTFYLSLKIPRS